MEEQKEIDSNTKEGEVIPKSTSEEEFKGIASVLEGVVAPFAKAQEISEQEATKRTTILASVASKIIYALVGIAAVALILAGYALSNGNEDFAEKIVIALFAFLGGLGAGKASSK